MLAFIFLGVIALLVGLFLLWIFATAAGVIIGIIAAIVQGTAARRQARELADTEAAARHLTPQETAALRKDIRGRMAREQAARGRQQAAARANRWNRPRAAATLPTTAEQDTQA